MPIPPFVLVRPPAQDFIRIWTQIALDPNLLTDQRSAVSFTYFMFYFPQARKTERKGKERKEVGILHVLVPTGKNMAGRK